MPQNSFAGEVPVMGVKVSEPVNLVLSVPPQVSSPFNCSPEELVIGSKETPISWALIVPCEKRLSVTVGISEFVAGDSVSRVRSTGPIPTIPSTPWKPVDVLATPMDCLVMTRPEAIVTVSVNSVPENEPEPYVTATLLVVWTLVLVFT